MDTTQSIIQASNYDQKTTMQQETFMKENWWKIRLSQTKLLWIACWCPQKMPLPQISQRKLPQTVNKTSNLQKVSSLKSFPLYSHFFDTCYLCVVTGFPTDGKEFFLKIISEVRGEENSLGSSL